MDALYLQIYQSIKDDIIKGKYQIGERLPSEKELAAQFQVSRITSKKALEKLMNDGLVYRQRGRGTFVTEETGNKQDQQVSTKKLLFGLIMTNLSASFGSKLVTSLLNETNEEVSFVLKVSLGIPEKEDKAMQELIDLGVDGMVIAPSHSEHYSSEILRMVIDKFPLVLIDRSIKRVGVNTVSTDNQSAAKLGANYLFELGHQHISVLIPSNYKTTSLEDRITGILDAYAENNLMVDKELWLSEIYGTPPSPLISNNGDIERIKKHIQNHPNITAFFALEYHIALLAKKAIEELGLHVPNDISIICFDSPSSNDIEFDFTYLKQNEKEIAEKALLRLIDMYNGNVQVHNDQIGAKLIAGSTTKRIR